MGTGSHLPSIESDREDSASSCPSSQSSVGPLPPINTNKSRVNRTHSFPGGSSGSGSNGAVKRRTRIPVVKNSSSRPSNSVAEAQHVYKESVSRKKSQRKKHVEPFNNIK